MQSGHTQTKPGVRKRGLSNPDRISFETTATVFGYPKFQDGKNVRAAQFIRSKLNRNRYPEPLSNDEFAFLNCESGTEGEFGLRFLTGSKPERSMFQPDFFSGGFSSFLSTSPGSAFVADFPAAFL